MIKKNKCIHKWIPNGIQVKASYKIYNNEYGYQKYEEQIYASCICQNCGKIKIEIVRDK